MGMCHEKVFYRRKKVFIFVIKVRSEHSQEQKIINSTAGKSYGSNALEVVDH